jgi:hypothetical protein
VVTNTDAKTGTLAGGFIINALPFINSISPATTSAGDTVTIAGSWFGGTMGTSYVSFNGVRATSYSQWSAGSIKCAVPQGAVSGNVTVVTQYGTSNAKSITIIYTKWYLPEGSTKGGFSTYISIVNPNGSATNATLTYMRTSGGPVNQVVNLPANSQTTVNPADTIGAADFSTKIAADSGKTISVDRTMTWTGPGAPSPEAHNSIGVSSPATTWYLPEGSSNWGFETWLLIQNPTTTAAHCTVTYMLEGSAPRSFSKIVPANSRASYSMAADIGTADASIKVVSDVPVCPERSMYRNNRREGSDSIGTTYASDTYYLAEGTTAWGYTTYVLVQNPNASAASVTLTYMTPGGPVAQAPFSIPADSRRTVRVNDVLPNTDFSTTVTANKPVIAERSMYWGSGTPLGEAMHDSIGTDLPHTTFYLPDGQTSGGRQTYTLVANPNGSAVQVRISYLGAGGVGNVTFTATVPAQSRMTFNLADRIPNGRASIVVTSLTAGKKIIAERSMYWNNKGAGTDTIGGFSD